MLLGFKRRFEAPILAKTKRHTIRGKRKIAPRVGEICHCYVDPRQKTMRLLGRWPCVRVQKIEIFFARLPGFPNRVFIDGQRLSMDECERLARSDGFASFEEMMDFWSGRLPFVGDIIHWDPDAKTAALSNSRTSRPSGGPTKKES